MARVDTSHPCVRRCLLVITVSTLVLAITSYTIITELETGGAAPTPGSVPGFAWLGSIRRVIIVFLSYLAIAVLGSRVTGPLGLLVLLQYPVILAMLTGGLTDRSSLSSGPAAWLVFSLLIVLRGGAESEPLLDYKRAGCRIYITPLLYFI